MWNSRCQCSSFTHLLLLLQPHKVLHGEPRIVDVILISFIQAIVSSLGAIPLSRCFQVVLDILVNDITFPSPLPLQDGIQSLKMINTQHKPHMELKILMAAHTTVKNPNQGITRACHLPDFPVVMANPQMKHKSWKTSVVKRKLNELNSDFKTTSTTAQGVNFITCHKPRFSRNYIILREHTFHCPYPHDLPPSKSTPPNPLSH